MLEAKTNLSKLVEAIESGAETEIIIARNGKPAARLTAIEPERRTDRFGVAKGLFEMPADFDRGPRPSQPVAARSFWPEGRRP